MGAVCKTETAKFIGVSYHYFFMPVRALVEAFAPVSIHNLLCDGLKLSRLLADIFILITGLFGKPRSI